MATFYAAISNFDHDKADRMKSLVVKVNFTPPLQSMAVTVCLNDGFMQLNEYNNLARG